MGALTLRVATFNIKNGICVKHDMARLAELIDPLELDVVGLQEVDVCTERAKGLDTLKLFSEAAGYKYYKFTPAIDYKGGKYGTAIMSRYPIVEYEAVKLRTFEGHEGRAYGHAVINVNGAGIDFYNTHLSVESRDARTVQFEQIDKAIDARRGFILTGDFNTRHPDRTVITSSKLVNPGIYPTFPRTGSDIDDIIVHKDWSITDSGILEIKTESDHNLLWAELTLNP
ncbi:MAG: endonuclease/exonuclease/phosphatase family protein [Clostridia bacterium]|nr:endonuclease/exonuclease/phosphatase family protein [Clostridia bacterium]